MSARRVETPCSALESKALSETRQAAPDWTQTPQRRFFERSARVASSEDPGSLKKQPKSAFPAHRSRSQASTVAPSWISRPCAPLSDKSQRSSFADVPAPDNNTPVWRQSLPVTRVNANLAPRCALTPLKADGDPTTQRSSVNAPPLTPTAAQGLRGAWGVALLLSVASQHLSAMPNTPHAPPAVTSNALAPAAGASTTTVGFPPQPGSSSSSSSPTSTSAFNDTGRETTSASRYVPGAIVTTPRAGAASTAAWIVAWSAGTEIGGGGGSRDRSATYAACAALVGESSRGSRDRDRRPRGDSALTIESAGDSAARRDDSVRFGSVGGGARAGVVGAGVAGAAAAAAATGDATLVISAAAAVAAAAAASALALLAAAASAAAT